MKETTKSIIYAMILIIIFSLCSYTETHYTREDCVVIEVQGQLVIVEDRVGELWCYEVEGEAPACGTVVDVYMHNNHTDNNIYDDEIVDVVVQ